MLSSAKCNRCKTERLNCVIKVQTPLCFTSAFFQFREIDEVFSVCLIEKTTMANKMILLLQHPS